MSPSSLRAATSGNQRRGGVEAGARAWPLGKTTSGAHATNGNGGDGDGAGVDGGGGANGGADGGGTDGADGGGAPRGSCWTPREEAAHLLHILGTLP